MTSWGLLSTWLFLGGVALAEQMSYLLETGAQDEQALSDLATGLKPDAPGPADPSSNSTPTATGAALTFASVDAVLQAPFAALLRLPALRLHQRVSVYRL